MQTMPALFGNKRSIFVGHRASLRLAAIWSRVSALLIAPPFPFRGAQAASLLAKAAVPSRTLTSCINIQGRLSSIHRRRRMDSSADDKLQRSTNRQIPNIYDRAIIEALGACATRHRAALSALGKCAMQYSSP